MNPDPKQKLHYYLITLMIAYRVGESTGIRHINTILPTEHQYVPMRTLISIQETTVQQAVMAGAIPPEAQTDPTVTSVSYLGKMTMAQFQEGIDIPDEGKAAISGDVPDLDIEEELRNKIWPDGRMTKPRHN